MMLSSSSQKDTLLHKLPLPLPGGHSDASKVIFQHHEYPQPAGLSSLPRTGTGGSLPVPTHIRIDGAEKGPSSKQTLTVWFPSAAHQPLESHPQPLRALNMGQVSLRSSFPRASSHILAAELRSPCQPRSTLASASPNTKARGHQS